MTLFDVYKSEDKYISRECPRCKRAHECRGKAASDCMRDHNRRALNKLTPKEIRELGY